MHNQAIATAPRRPRLYHGWIVVAAAFLIAMFGFGLGFYGPGIYIVALEARHGWSIAELSPAITSYYVLGGTSLFFCVGPLFERCGPRCVVVGGSLALACGVVALGAVTRLWQVYAAFAVMSLGWSTMSGGAINIIIAPWFDRRRGVALSWALNGASAGGIVAPPLLIFLVAHVGFATALNTAALTMLAILFPVVALVLRGRRPGERHALNISPGGRQPGGAEAPGWHLTEVLRNPDFLTISAAFALGLTAQVGFLTHQVAFLTPVLGTVAAGWAVSLTTGAAVVGRTVAGTVADRVNRRVLAAGNFGMQIAGMALLWVAPWPGLLWLGCALFGLGLGNTTSFPGLIVQREFPAHHFARVVSLVVAINQFSFAFGPSVLGQLYRLHGGYGTALLVCLVMQTMAAVIIGLPLLRRRKIAT